MMILRKLLCSSARRSYCLLTHSDTHGDRSASTVSGLPPFRRETSHSMSRSRPPAATAAAAVLGLGLVLGATGTALAGAPTRSGPAPAVTRAGLDPSLVAGRGANVGVAEQEAENAATNGTVFGPDRSAYTLPAEASG